VDVNKEQGRPPETPVWNQPLTWIAGVVAIAGLIMGPACSKSDHSTAASKHATASSGQGMHDKMGTASSGQDMNDNMKDNMGAAGSQSDKVGQTGPKVSVATLAGSTFVVPTGKPTALWFTANGCTSCIPKAKALAKIKSDVGDRIAVLGVDMNPTDTEAIFRRWIGEVGNPPFEFAMDKGGQLAVAWGVRDTSTVVICDAAGKIVYHSTGTADEATFRSALAKAGLA
jgi:thiol-disulfide isomerase/thioredoxin